MARQRTAGYHQGMNVISTWPFARLMHHRLRTFAVRVCAFPATRLRAGDIVKRHGAWRAQAFISTAKRVLNDALRVIICASCYRRRFRWRRVSWRRVTSACSPGEEIAGMFGDIDAILPGTRMKANHNHERGGIAP